MNYSTTLIGILFLLIFIVPILYSVIKSKNNKRKAEQLILKLMEKHHLTPTNTIVVGNHQFFLDTNTKKLMQLEIKKSKVIEENIWEIKNLNTVKVEYSHYTSPSNTTFIQEIRLHVQEKSGIESSIQIYDEDTGDLTAVDHYKQEIEKVVDQVKALR